MQKYTLQCGVEQNRPHLPLLPLLPNFKEKKKIDLGLGFSFLSFSSSVCKKEQHAAAYTVDEHHHRADSKGYLIFTALRLFFPSDLPFDYTGYFIRLG